MVRLFNLLHAQLITPTKFHQQSEWMNEYFIKTGQKWAWSVTFASYKIIHSEWMNILLKQDQRNLRWTFASYNIIQWSCKRGKGVNEWMNSLLKQDQKEPEVLRRCTNWDTDTCYNGWRRQVTWTELGGKPRIQRHRMNNTTDDMPELGAEAGYEI